MKNHLLRNSITLLIYLFYTMSSIGQNIKIEPFTINYPITEKLNIAICAPFKEYSIEGMNTPDDMGWTYDYYEESLRQFKILFDKMFTAYKHSECIGDLEPKSTFHLDCRLESQSTGKVVTAFSKLSLEITLTWKLTRLSDGEVIFREKAKGIHKNKIGNAFNGKSKANERASKALEAAFIESLILLESKFKSL